jgi:AhpD family alkylhydroperoxidase
MTQRLAYETVMPDGARSLGGVYLYLSRSGLSKSLLDLVYLRASLINGCAYCIDSHSSDLRKDGMAIEKIALVPVWREAEGLFDKREQAALAWTEVVTRIADTHAPEADYQAAREVFSEKELADLTLAIGLINVYNRLAISFRKTPQSLLAAKAG